MPITLEWPEIFLRLALTVLAGTILGLNRTERGMTAGLRTTLLVCLAASASMIQVNLLLDTHGRPGDSLIMMDLMRLPLGILTGMGFIGAGAILRQGGRVSGLTTAATLWLATVIGLCFGGGQHGLGLATLGLGVLILWALKRLESLLPQEKRAVVSLRVHDGGPDDRQLQALMNGCKVTSWASHYPKAGDVRTRRVRFEIHWSSTTADPLVPEFVTRLVETPGVSDVRWKG